MSPSVAALLPSDPTCVFCSKPVRSGGFVQTPTGEVFHIHCRSRQLHLISLDRWDRARLALERATDLVEESRRQRRVKPRRLTERRDRCPVCSVSATLTDWRPTSEWMAVEGCLCHGFFAWTPLLDEGRLARLTPEDRDTLSLRLRVLRSTQSEAWLSTRDGTVMGALIIRDQRPDRPM